MLGLLGFFVDCTQNIQRSAQVPILLQQQTVLVANRSAQTQRSGRFRNGVGTAGNLVGSAGLHEKFYNRGRRSGERSA